MNENQEIIARAFEIAIKLNAGKELSLITDSEGNVLMSDCLLNTMRTVIRVFNSNNFDNIIKECKKETIWVYEKK